MDGAFGELRHALAHRIPLYIPPYVIQHADVAAYDELAKKMNEAIMALDFAAYDNISAEQLKLGRFQPWISQSFSARWLRPTRFERLEGPLMRFPPRGTRSAVFPPGFRSVLARSASVPGRLGKDSRTWQQDRAGRDRFRRI